MTLVRSGGVLVPSGKSATMTWTQAESMPFTSGVSGRHSSYSALYQRHTWVSAATRKLALANARLPRKAYEGQSGDRERLDASHPLAKLVRTPHPRIPAFAFWSWIEAAHTVFGEALLEKQYDRGGRTIQLNPLHPTNLLDVRDNGTRYIVYREGRQLNLPADDFVHFRGLYPNIDNPYRGASPLESLRADLELDFASKASAESLWQRGARPGMIVKHSGNLSEDAQKRLKSDIENRFTGPKNAGRPMILEEGMDVQLLDSSMHASAYIDSRKLTREEVCGAIDVPPPAIHILDRATFSNIDTQKVMLYTETMAPRNTAWASCFNAAVVADSWPDCFVELDMNEILRGDPESQAANLQTLVQSGMYTINEARRAYNMPGVEGGDVSLVNSAVMPLAQALARPVTGSTKLGPLSLRSLMGRLSPITDVTQIDADQICKGLSPAQTDAVQLALMDATDIDHFKQLIS